MGGNGAQPDKQALIGWVGDIGLNGIFCEPHGHDTIRHSLAQLRQTLGPCGLIVGNLETPLWGDGSVNLQRNVRLCTTRQAAECILPLGLDVVLLAGNHMYDCREKGFENTVRFLEDSGIRWLGAGRSNEHAAEPLTVERNGLSLGLVSYLGEETYPELPPDAGVFLNLLQSERATKEVRELAGKVDCVLVHLHWGIIEHIQVPSVGQRRFARQLVEAGATVVVAHHAHAMMGHEPWKDGHIFYGLGNFLFAPVVTVPSGHQWMWSLIDRQGGVAVCTLQPGRVVDADIKPTLQNGYEICWDDTPARRNLMRRLDRKLGLSDKSLERAYRKEVFLSRTFGTFARIVRESGGLLPTLGRLRWRQVANALKLISGR